MPKLISWAGKKIENKPVDYDFFYILTTIAMGNEQRSNMVNQVTWFQKIKNRSLPVYFRSFSQPS